MCANLADPALAGATRGRGPVATGAISMLAKHGPPPAARGGGTTPVATPGLSAGHGPRRVACDGSLAAAAVPGLSVGHGPLRAARDRGPVVVAGLQWTCGQRQITCSWRRSSQQPQHQQTQQTLLICNVISDGDSRVHVLHVKIC